MQSFSKPTIAVERVVPGAVECPLPARTGLRDIAAKENRLKTKKCLTLGPKNCAVAQFAQNLQFSLMYNIIKYHQQGV